MNSDVWWGRGGEGDGWGEGDGGVEGDERSDCQGGDCMMIRAKS